MSRGDSARAAVELLLAAAARNDRRILFWWRDDDAETPTPELDRLIALAARHRLPLALAVIPAGATQDLAARVRAAAGLTVLQHGWRHANHAPPDAKKAELGAGRPVGEVLGELAAGRDRLGLLFGERFLPILVPPWNRIAVEVAERLGEAGLIGLSTFGARRAREVNTHLDIFDWKGTRGPLPRHQALAVLAAELERRLAGEDEPLGILTHHLRHQPESWDLLEELFSLLGPHPAAVWPPPTALFPQPPATA
jgi:hypothetical protein